MNDLLHHFPNLSKVTFGIWFLLMTHRKNVIQMTQMTLGWGLIPSSDGQGPGVAVVLHNWNISRVDSLIRNFVWMSMCKEEIPPAFHQTLGFWYLKPTPTKADHSSIQELQDAQNVAINDDDEDVIRRPLLFWKNNVVETATQIASNYDWCIYIYTHAHQCFFLRKWSFYNSFAKGLSWILSPCGIVVLREESRWGWNRINWSRDLLSFGDVW